MKATVDDIYQRVYENGVMIRVSGPNIILSPPLVISEAEVNTVIAALDTALTAVSQ
jgi:adenosylmethionine-8-amino-7-oxononanoate aminotransferase